ncbi:hypothetical protein ACHAWF_016924 [Thalassiosira exigua]
MATRRNHRAAAPAAPPSSHRNERGVRERWPVLVYRLQSHRGWEVYSDPDHERTAPPAGKKAANATAASDSGGGGGSDDALTATPRAGCIEVRKMRLRIQLFAQHAPWDPSRPSRRGGGGGDRPPEAPRLRREGEGADPDEAVDDRNDDDGDGEDGDDGYDSDVPGGDGWNNNSLLVRRRDALLVTTRRGMGAVVFRFRSTRDCVDFCDRLVELNWERLAPERSPASPKGGDDEKKASPAADGGRTNGLDGRDRRVEEANEAKRRRLVALLDPSGDETGDRAPTMGDSPPSAATAEDARLCRRRDELTSYMVRLAHSEEFRGFVDELERGLESAPDTAAIRAALGV